MKRKNSKPNQINPGLNFLTKIDDLPTNFTFSIQNLLNQNKLKQIYQFNFMADVDWLMKITGNEIKTTLICQHLSIQQQNTQFKNLNVIQPYLPIPYGTHHTKAMLLFTENDQLQIIIHTANLIPSDWKYKTQVLRI